MGGVIYIINLINALNSLADDDKPEIILFHNPDLTEFIEQIKYPYLTAVPAATRGETAKKYILSFIVRKNLFVDKWVKEYQLDGLYPLNDQPISSNYLEDKYNCKAVSWFPDLQHRFYPKFFTRKQWWLREVRLRILLRNTNNLVVSSNDVRSHFHKFYTLRKDMKIHTLHFSSALPKINEDQAGLLHQYKLPSQYFMVSNQFHNHKNHQTVLKALEIVRKTNPSVHVAFTGKMESSINHEYIAVLKTLIADNNLADSITFLGVIPRADQLGLMKFSQAIIQPSLFEGWSTVIEDAISLQVPVLAANLSVNIEQLGDRGFYFDPHNENELAALIANFKQPLSPLYEPYAERIKRFATTFVNIF
jgi:glycosyltransferase involved in cell wall biosynthesis